MSSGIADQRVKVDVFDGLTVAFVLPVHATASGGLPNVDPVGGPVAGSPKPGLSRNKRKNRTLRSKVLGACDLGRLSGLDDRCLLACRAAESLVRQMTIECCLRNMQSGADVMR